MTLERWNPEKHLPLVHEWARLRGMGPDAGHPGMFPPNGFVADGIVVGFLYLTQSKQAFMDSFIGDPRASKEARAAAIHDIMGAIVVEARELGVRMLVGAISIPSLAAHVKRCGFTVLDNCHYVYGRI